MSKNKIIILIASIIIVVSAAIAIPLIAANQPEDSPGISAISLTDPPDHSGTYKVTLYDRHPPDVILALLGSSNPEEVALGEGWNTPLELYVQPDTFYAPPQVGVSPAYEFKGWYRDQGFTRAWITGEDTVKSDIPLYGKWEIAD